MKRHASRLVPFLMTALLIAACNRDVPTGLPAMSASSAVGDNKLKDAIAFFTRDFDPTNGGLAVMNSDGSGRRPLAGGEFGFEPSISPDGRQIAFSRNTDVGVTSIYVMNVDGTGTTEVAQGLVFNPTPRWSPTAVKSRSRGVMVISKSGRGFRSSSGWQRVYGHTDPVGLRIRRTGVVSDSARLAFTRNSALHVINVDGTGMNALPNEDMAQNAVPDGQRIAYFSLGPWRDPHAECRRVQPHYPHFRGVRFLASLVGRWTPARLFAFHQRLRPGIYNQRRWDRRYWSDSCRCPRFHARLGVSALVDALQ
jgi:hypothetical protein